LGREPPKADQCEERADLGKAHTSCQPGAQKLNSRKAKAARPGTSEAKESLQAAATREHIVLLARPTVVVHPAAPQACTAKKTQIERKYGDFTEGIQRHFAVWLNPLCLCNSGPPKSGIAGLADTAGEAHPRAGAAPACGGQRNRFKGVPGQGPSKKGKIA